MFCFDITLANLSLILSCLAFNYSGGYFNPALATSLKFGCEGNTFVEHMVVYWVGATAGSIASVYFYNLSFIQKCVDKVKPKEKEE